MCYPDGCTGPPDHELDDEEPFSPPWNFEFGGLDYAPIHVQCGCRQGVSRDANYSIFAADFNVPCDGCGEKISVSFSVSGGVVSDSVRAHRGGVGGVLWKITGSNSAIVSVVEMDDGRVIARVSGVECLRCGVFHQVELEKSAGQ